jgi:hypothetical protein
MQSAVTVTLLTLIFIVDGCGLTGKNRLYETISKNSTLTAEVIFQSDQIVGNNEDLLLIYDISTDVEKYDPYILFYNSERKLVGTCYFASQKIERINNDTIVGELNESRQSRPDRFQFDIPSNYHLDLQKVDIRKGSLRMSNKIIKSIDFDENLMKAELTLKVSENSFEWTDRSRIPGNLTELDSLYPDSVVIFDLADLVFKQDDDMVISTTSRNLYGKRIIEEMIVFESKVMEEFLSSISMALIKPD